MGKGLIFLTCVSFLASGCGKQLSDYVGKDPALPGKGSSPSLQPVTPIVMGTQGHYKISPMSNQTTGTQVISRFTITPTMRTVQGTQVQSTFSIQANRRTE